MLRFLKKFMGGSSTAQTSSPQNDAAPGGNAEPTFATWLEADAPNNPFGVSGFDCSSFVASMLSTTKDLAIAESFVRLRNSDGHEHIDQLPTDAVAVDCNLSFTGEAKDGPLFKASAMEDKWDIYLWNSRLTCCRSWTGELCFVADLSISAGQLVVRRVWYSPAQTTSSLAIEELHFLIMSHLCGSPTPHPLPPDLPPEPQTVALFSFSQYGRRCWFGTYNNTVGPHVPEVAGDA